MAKNENMQILTITPTMAKEFLVRRHPRQRPFRPKHVALIKADIVAGKFKFLADPIRFIQPENLLVDGQHRLSAIVAADRPLQALIVHLKDADALQYIDTRFAARTVRDTEILRGIKGTNNSVRSAIVLEHQGFFRNVSAQPPVSVVDRVEIAANEPLSSVLQALYRASANNNTKATSGYLGGALTCLRIEPERAFEFFLAAFGNDPSVSGVPCQQAAKLSKTMIARALEVRTRRGAMVGRRAILIAAQQCVRIWNAYTCGKEVKQLRDDLKVPTPQYWSRR